MKSRVQCNRLHHHYPVPKATLMVTSPLTLLPPPPYFLPFAYGDLQRSSFHNGVAPLPLLSSQEDVGSGAFRASKPERNAPPLQGRPVLPGRGRARPLVHPHRLASPPGSPEVEALNSEEAMASCVSSISTSFP